jgi:hypothetical protein
VLWARLPEPVTTNTTVGDVASDWMLQAAAHRANPPTLTLEEQAQVAACRAMGAATAEQSDLEVLALARPVVGKTGIRPNLIPRLRGLQALISAISSRLNLVWKGIQVDK